MPSAALPASPTAVIDPLDHADRPGYSILAAAEDTTSGVLSFTTLNTNWRRGPRPHQPDLLVTTQSIWNTIWERSQPSERNSAGDLREIGYRTVRFNSAIVTVDSHVPTGYICGLNTDYFRVLRPPEVGLPASAALWNRRTSRSR